MNLGRLILFVTAPRLGAVKTRLAAEIGHLGAWRFYNTMLWQLWVRLGNDRRWETQLAVSPDKSNARWPVYLTRFGQGQGNLGTRMARAMQRYSGPVVLVGSDLPDLDRHHVAGAIKSLRQSDVVFGPTKDGGFWLVGLRRTHWAERLFRNARWSSPYALADCLSNLPTTARITLLETLSDVDTVDDYNAYYKCSRRRGKSSAKLQGL